MAFQHKASPTITFAVVLLIFATTSARVTASYADVNIWNDIGLNELLQLRCASRTTHLGGDHNLTYGSKWGFGFRPNLWGTTLYYCEFGWGARYQAFDAWRGTFPFPCVHCEYRVGPDGFWRNERGEQPTLFMPWR